MPIKGITDGQAAFPRIGILRKGGPRITKKRKDGSEYTAIGSDLDHFRFVPEPEDDKILFQAFKAAYGEKPRLINVYLPFATTDENLEAWKEHWVAGGLKHRCDGETAILWQDEQSEYHHTPKPCPGECKPVGRLMVIVPELKRLAYVQVLTGSWHDCRELAENLRAAENAAHLMGRDLRGIPFVLTRAKHKISTPTGENGKRARREKWLLHIEPAPSWVALQIEAARQMALPTVNGEMLALAEPEDEADTIVDTETGEMIKAIVSPEETITIVDPETGETLQLQKVEQPPGNGDFPRKPDDLLVHVNNQVQVPYDNVFHLNGGIKKIKGIDWNWPLFKDLEGWQDAAMAAITYAESKI